MSCAEKVRPAGPRHRRQGEVRRQPLDCSAQRRDGRPHARMKAHEGAATNRNSRGGAGHHVVIAGAVVVLVVTNERTIVNLSLIAARRSMFSLNATPGVCVEIDPNSRESPPVRPAWGRTFQSGSARRRARTECSSSARAASQPRDRFAAPRRRERTSEHAPQTELQTISATHAGAIAVDGHRRVSLRERCRSVDSPDQSTNKNSGVFISAQNRSSTPTRRLLADSSSRSARVLSSSLGGRQYASK